MVWSPSDGGENPYVHALATSDAVVVTPDTITMTSEALSSNCSEGAYVMMSDIPTGKFQVFFKQLQDVRNVEAGKVEENEEKGMLAGVPGVKRLYPTNVADDLNNIERVIVDRIQQQKKKKKTKKRCAEGRNESLL